MSGPIHQLVTELIAFVSGNTGFDSLIHEPVPFVHDVIDIAALDNVVEAMLH